VAHDVGNDAVAGGMEARDFYLSLARYQTKAWP
jgi:hypothetical protein